MSKAWGQVNTRQWRKIRAAVLLANSRLNGGRCRLNVGRGCPRHGRPCPGVCTGTANVVHHVRGKAVTGDDQAWLMATCAKCNGHVGDPSKYPNAARCTPVDWY
jgi:5-methylcytosine-specific restriction endonuclease McrA